MNLRSAIARIGLIVRVGGNDRYRQQVEIAENRGQNASRAFLQEKMSFIQEKKIALEIHNIKWYTPLSRNA